jgi:hypothetical protein
MTREETFNELVRCNVVKVEIEFSGGNDEGGADSVELINPAGAKTQLRYEYGANDNSLYEALCGPLDRWGSFAGEFYVNGTITWDVPIRKVFLSYLEQAMQPTETADHEEV